MLTKFLQMLPRFCAVCFIAVLASTTALAGSTVFSDTEFDDNDWNDVIMFVTNGASGVAGNMADGGNPGSYREMDHTMPGAIVGTNTQYWIFHAYTAATYDPVADDRFTEPVGFRVVSARIPPPLPPPPVPELGIHETTESVVQISWQSQTGVSYQIESSDDGLSWSRVGDPVPGTGGTMLSMQPVAGGQKLFRLAVTR